MEAQRQVIVFPDRETLARSVAERFLATANEVLREHDRLTVMLTGGSVGIAVLAAIAVQQNVAQLDWARVHMWWGDERWLPEGHPERNDRQARDALLNHVPIPPENIHPYPTPDSGMRLDAAARQQGERLWAFGEGREPSFDITFLGVGPDGHVASIFPGDSGASAAEADVIAVPDSPKPPAQRLSVTIPLINSSQRVWLVLAGADKSIALSRALGGAKASEVPAAAVTGVSETVFFVDRDAASNVPPDVTTPARP